MAGLVPERCAAFVAQYPQYEEILTAIFAQTRYLTTADVLASVDRQLQRWKEGRDSARPLVVGLPRALGSEHWLYGQFRDRLPEHTVQQKYFSPSEPIELLLCDDCTLSGCNLCALIEDLLWAEDAGRRPVHLTVITAVATVQAQRQIQRVADPLTLSVTFFHEYTFHPFRPPATVPPATADAFLQEFLPDTLEWSYPLHLEYKVANQWGSFPRVYFACRDPPVRPYPSHK